MRRWAFTTGLVLTTFALVSYGSTVHAVQVSPAAQPLAPAAASAAERDPIAVLRAKEIARLRRLAGGLTPVRGAVAIPRPRPGWTWATTSTSWAPWTPGVCSRKGSAIRRTTPYSASSHPRG